MKALLYKEFRLFVGKINYFFMAFPLMIVIPGGYPILFSAFFVCMGIFTAFQLAREANDTLFSVLLPIRKADAVRARYLSCAILELSAFLLSAIFVALRVTVLAKVGPYTMAPALMPGNLAFLGYLLLAFSLFNGAFIRGFYRTGYAYAKPYILFVVWFCVLAIAAEVIWHIPGLSFLAGVSGGDLLRQLPLFLFGALCYVLVTLLSCRAAMSTFEKIDL